MIQVYQTRFGAPDGNCWEACLASILEIDLGEIPDPRPDGPRPTWTETAQWVLREHRRLMLCSPFEVAGGSVALPCYHILSGRTSAGLAHAVVAFGDEIVHNPSPRPGSDLVSVGCLEILMPAVRGVDLPFEGFGVQGLEEDSR